MYSSTNQVDDRALRILYTFNPLIKKGGVHDDDYRYAVSKGLLFEPDKLTLTHDEAQHRLMVVVAKVDRATVVELFLRGLSTMRHDFRAGLPAYALGRTFTQHTFKPTTGPYCAICGLAEDVNVASRNFVNKCRFQGGGVVGRCSAVELLLYLEFHCQLSAEKPSESDVNFLLQILSALERSAPKETIKKAAQRVRKIPKLRLNAEQVQCLLETLGYCGVLETPEHGGMLKRYVNLGTAPAKTHRSDWSYPVDFWEGSHGLNKEAVRFWFGSYEGMRAFFQ